MSLPSVVKTHQYSVNQALGNPGTNVACSQKFIRAMVTSLLGFASNPWVMDYSCDSTTAGTKSDGVNRWSADNKLVWATTGVAHSWAVLTSNGPGTGFEVLIACEMGSGGHQEQITIVTSVSSGFTGGTTTARPTATDEQVWCNGFSSQSFCGYNSAIWNAVLHVMMSTDGQLTRIVFMSANWMQSFWFFDRANPQISAWTNPAVAGFVAATAGVPASDGLTYTNMVRNTKCGTKISTVLTMYWTVEGCNGSTVGEQQISNDDDSFEWPILPVGLFSLTSLHRGRKGLLVDIWMGSTGINDGDTYPDDATKLFTQFGHGIFAWNGTTPLVS